MQAVGGRLYSEGQKGERTPLQMAEGAKAKCGGGQVQCIAGDQEAGQFGLKETSVGMKLAGSACHQEFCLQHDKTEGTKISGFPEGEFRVRGQ